MFTDTATAIEAGPVALARIDALRSRAPNSLGRVLSVSAHACYLDVGGWLLLLSHTLRAGPMTVRVTPVSKLPDVSPFLSIAVGDAVRLSQTTLTVADQLEVQCKSMVSSDGCHVLQYKSASIDARLNMALVQQLLFDARVKSPVAVAVATAAMQIPVLSESAAAEMNGNTTGNTGCSTDYVVSNDAGNDGGNDTGNGNDSGNDVGNDTGNGINATTSAANDTACQSNNKNGSNITQAITRYISEEITLLHHWLVDALTLAGPTRQPPLGLLGAGHGLTPAGDDCLAGVVLMLQMTNQQRVADRLIHEIQQQVVHRTHAVSAELLKLCCQGYANAALLRAMAKLHQTGYTSGPQNQTRIKPNRAVLGVSERQPTGQIATNCETKSGERSGFTGRDALSSEIGLEFDALGHSSGWDTFAGVALVALISGQKHPHGAVTHSSTEALRC